QISLEAVRQQLLLFSQIKVHPMLLAGMCTRHRDVGGVEGERGGAWGGRVTRSRPGRTARHPPRLGTPPKVAAEDTVVVRGPPRPAPPAPHPAGPRHCATARASPWR